MTDETFPHEIWADLDHWIEGPAASDLRAQGYMKYTRTDRANELVAAAYDAAALEASEWSLAARSYIRDLTPADAVAALAARDARIREAAMETAISVAASLAAAISLLENGGKNAAPSDRMFEQMLKDYRKSLDDFRALIAKDKANG